MSDPSPFDRFIFDLRLKILADRQARKMADLQECFHTEDLDKHFYEYTALAENVASGQPTFEHAIIDWMNSPGHRANILNPAYTHAGGGVARGSDGRLYWCVIFGGK